jgi:hypothetical protein
MRYLDGTPALHGDIIIGKGYNIDHDIIGTVIGLVPGVGACDIRIAVAKVEMIPEGDNAVGYYRTGAMIHRNSLEEPLFTVWPEIEYGTCKDFTLIRRALKK